jgi:hypothetical protein
LAVGCADARTSRLEPYAEPSLENFPGFANAKLSPSEAAIKGRIEQKLREGPRGCNLSEGFGSCDTMEISFSPAQVAESSRGQRILVLEDQSIPKSSLLRYSQRVLGFFRIHSRSGQVSDYRPRLNAPRLLLDVVERDLKGTGNSLDAQKLGSLGYDLLKLHHKAKVVWPADGLINHGDYVFDWLADLNPEAQFLLGPFPEPEVSLFCEMGSQSGRNQLRRFFKNAAGGIVERMTNVGITHVNLSYSTTSETIRKHLSNFCPNLSSGISDEDIAAYLAIKTQVLSELNHSGALIFGAVPNDAFHILSVTNPGDSFICEPMERVFRVGYFNQVKSKVRRHGANYSERSIPYNQRSSEDCVDAYVNGGIDEAKSQRFQQGHTIGVDQPTRSEVWWGDDSLFYFYEGVCR